MFGTSHSLQKGMIIRALSLTEDFNNSRSLLFGLIRGKPSTNANLEFGLQDLLSRSVSLGILCTQGSSSNGSPRFTIWWKVSMVWGGSEGGCSVATLVVLLLILLLGIRSYIGFAYACGVVLPLSGILNAERSPWPASWGLFLAVSVAP
ncbi:hypothetical protein M514_28329 [Trichuris suis]|uniref:Uncharacterized protein n=1 Tax=Trichuris suis TaxID=68888 RepID=A0A085MQJ6_9BILA|nr:hypothetical protein M514_28329 [Trichuris suis]